MQQHTIRYQVLNQHQASAEENFRDIDVLASREELQSLQTCGYLLRESLFQGAELQALREGLDRLFEAEIDLSSRPTRDHSWGVILRYLEDKDPVFLELIQNPAFVSVARAMMGPLVRIRGLSGRISWPGEEVQSTPYHQHLRFNSVPRPAWFCDAHGLDVLIYLDDLNHDTGAVCVIPESHTWVDREPPFGVYEGLEEEVSFEVPAGSAVMMHANLWHRAAPTLATRRRMLILSYTPCWMRRSPYGSPPENGLTTAALTDADEELRELLGAAGHS